AADIQPAHIGKLDVEQDEIGVFRLDKGQAPLSGGGLEQGIAEPFQGVGFEIAPRLVVVHHQDLRDVAFRHASPLARAPTASRIAAISVSAVSSDFDKILHRLLWASSGISWRAMEV